MRYKAQIKRITKLQKPPFGDGMYTWEIETTQHIGLYYTSKMSYDVGDEIEYGYIEQKNKAWKLDGIKKTAMFNNYSKNSNNQEYANSQEIKDNNIFFQSARRDFVLMNQGRNLSVQEINDGAFELYKKHKQIKNQL